MLWSKAIGAGGAGGAGGDGVTLNYELFQNSVTTTTFPIPTGVAGNLAIVSYTGLYLYMPTLPAGWTQIYYNSNVGANRQAHRIMYKVLTEADEGTNVTIYVTTSLSADYGTVYLKTFSIPPSLSSVNISSLNADIVPFASTTAVTSGLPGSSIIVATGSTYSGSTVPQSYSDETYWDVIDKSTASFVSTVFALEIQETLKTNRDILAVFQTGSNGISVSFVLTLS